jgi:hypothetical protein
MPQEAAQLTAPAICQDAGGFRSAALAAKGLIGRGATRGTPRDSPRIGRRGNLPASPLLPP